MTRMLKQALERVTRCLAMFDALGLWNLDQEPWTRLWRDFELNRSQTLAGGAGRFPHPALHPVHHQSQPFRRTY